MAIALEQWHGYYAEKCPRCEALKLKTQEYKQILACENGVPGTTAATTNLVWLPKRDAVAFRQAQALHIRCYECAENEVALEWYQCQCLHQHKTSRASIHTIHRHTNRAALAH